MASLYNINRSVEAYEFRMIDPADGQLKLLTDIPSLGGGGGGGSGYTDGEIDTLLNGKIDRVSGVEQSVSNDFNVLGQLKTHTVNTSGDVNMAFFRNGTQFFTLEMDGTIKLMNFANDGGVIVNRMFGNYFSNRSYSSDTVFEGSNVAGNAREEYMRYNYATGVLSIAKPLSLTSALKQDVIDTTGDVDLTFKRNDVEYCKLRNSAGVRLMDFPTSGGVSADVMYGNLFANRTNGLVTIFEGSNVAGDGREEYMRYNYDTGILSIAKPLSLSSALKQDVIDTTGNVDLTVKRNDVEYFSLELDGTIKLMNFANDGGVSVNRVFGNFFSNRSYSLDTIFEGSNTAGDARVEYMRYDYANELLKIPTKMLINGGEATTEIHENIESGNNVFRIWNRATTNNPLIHLRCGGDDNDLVVRSDLISMNKAVSCANTVTIAYNNKLKWGLNSIVETTSETVPVTRFEAPNTGSSYEFVIGNVLSAGQRLFVMTNSDVTCKREFKCNNFDTESNSDMVLQRNNDEFMRFNVVDRISRVQIPIKLAMSGGLNESIIYEADEVTQNALRIWNKDESLTNSNVSIGVGAQPNVMFFRSNFAQCNEELKVDTINTTGDNDLVFQRNGVEYFKFDGSSSIVNIPSGVALSTTDVYTNEYRPRSDNTDTIWYGLQSGGTGTAEIFRYDYSAEALDFNTVIDNTSRSIIGNIIDTTVSEKKTEKEH